MIELSNYYVAYFDILGYKDYFKNESSKVMEFVIAVESAIKETLKTLQSIQNSPVMQLMADEKISHRIFSDNILLCMPVTTLQYEKIRLLTFLTIICDIQRNFINDFGLFIRGAVTKGSFLITENSIHGQALIDAVELENSAEFPRILVAKDVTNLIFTSVLTEAEQQEITNFSEKVKNGSLLTLEESQLQNQYILRLQNDLAARKWYNTIIFLDIDNSTVLNYLYNLDIREIYPQVFEQMDNLLMLFSQLNAQSDLTQLKQDLAINPIERTKQFLEKHREKLLSKLTEYGTYNDIDISNKNAVQARHRIIKKYSWTLLQHNTLCQNYNLLNYAINIPVGLNIFTLEPQFIINSEKLQQGDA